MLQRLTAFLQDLTTDAAPAAPAVDQLQLAAAALLAEAARLDGPTGPRERAAIVRLLRERFDLAESEAVELCALAERSAAQSSQYFGFVHLINQRFGPEQRIELVEMLWEVIYADGRLDDLEANLMRRMAGLLYISDQECGAARKRVLARIEERRGR
jgi:uncharacterized tellurite resistance protein B-like protein